MIRVIFDCDGAAGTKRAGECEIKEIITLNAYVAGGRVLYNIITELQSRGPYTSGEF